MKVTFTAAEKDAGDSRATVLDGGPERRAAPPVKGRRTAGVEFTLRPNRHSVSVSKEDKGTQKH